jgi:hypothetical protein
MVEGKRERREWNEHREDGGEKDSRPFVLPKMVPPPHSAANKELRPEWPLFLSRVADCVNDRNFYLLSELLSRMLVAVQVTTFVRARPC